MSTPIPAPRKTLRLFASSEQNASPKEPKEGYFRRTDKVVPNKDANKQGK